MADGGAVDEAADCFVDLMPLEKQATIQIEVLNVLGKKQKTIFEGERKIGDHRYELSGELDNFTSGIYFIRLIINNQAIIRKIILQK